MSMDLVGKEENHFLILYYEMTYDYGKNIIDKEHEEKDYKDWLNSHKRPDRRLMNIIRHPDMDRNILIHYFESTPLGDIKSLSDIEGFS